MPDALFQETPVDPISLVCPTPITSRDKIVLGHGSGGRLSANLLRDVFLPLFSNPVLDLSLRNYVKGKIVVLVDNSKSMSRVDNYARPEDRLVPAHVLGSVALSNNDPHSVNANIDKDLATIARMEPLPPDIAVSLRASVRE